MVVDPVAGIFMRILGRSYDLIRAMSDTKRLLSESYPWRLMPDDCPCATGTGEYPVAARR